MTIKWLEHIHLHPSIWLTIVVSLLTGMFVEVSIIFIIVIWHEAGHLIAARLFNWKIVRVTIWLFGGVMETEEHGHKPMIEQLIVTVAGPIQHAFIYLLLLWIHYIGLLPTDLILFALRYNFAILAFNLIPAWPLDGGKLLHIGLSECLPFKKAYDYTLILSMLILFGLLIGQLYYQYNLLNAIIVITFLIWENRLEWKQRFYVFQRFLLKRMEQNQDNQKLLPLSFPSQTSMIEVFSRFYAGCFHPILIEDQHVLTNEQTCLNYYFQTGYYHAKLADLIKQ
ncbi:site-2 protease family protein [Amphibacillus sediminis]|uniref:site-2 protease family protein n=1 Tax=Amphibacillus sediminis TaxID=360185 RepID=UPI00082BC6B3|nr:site-2 protease family protein [Amphibacillus sediminis]